MWTDQMQGTIELKGEGHFHQRLAICKVCWLWSATTTCTGLYQFTGSKVAEDSAAVEAIRWLVSDDQSVRRTTCFGTVIAQLCFSQFLFDHSPFVGMLCSEYYVASKLLDALSDNLDYFVQYKYTVLKVFCVSPVCALLIVLFAQY